MKNLIKLLCLFAYAFFVFFINDIRILALLFIVNIVFMLIIKAPVKKAIIFLWRITPFILFAGAINWITGSLEECCFMAIRLYLVCNISFSFSFFLSATQIANAVETLFFPLSFFQKRKNKLNTITPKDIGLMVSIAVAFIPIIKNDFFNVRSALKSKGLKIGVRNFKYVLKPFLFLVLSRTNDITNALKAKAYQ